MTKVRVECYGGGHRWTCPKCDTNSPDNGIATNLWTNSTPPKNDNCPKCTPKSFLEIRDDLENQGYLRKEATLVARYHLNKETMDALPMKGFSWQN